MEYKKFGNKYIVRIDRGEEIVETLKKFCEDNNIKLGTIIGLGATNKATVGLYNTEEKKYYSEELTGDHEITSLYGNISTMNNEIYLHIHATLCNQETRAFGGHLNSAVVSATFEAVIEVIDGEVDRAFNEEIGLNLYKFK